MPKLKRKLYFLLVFSLTAVLLKLTGNLLITSSFWTNHRFESFEKEVFRQEMSGDTIGLHYTLSDPSKYQIKSSAVTLGNGSLQARKNSLAALNQYHSLLHHFSYDKLSAKHQLTYKIFDKYLESELSASKWLLYDEPLGETLGIQAQLPILLAEYAFRTKGDIEDYLTLLSQIPDYFDSILSFEQEKADAGLFMPRECALSIVKQCDTFAESNYLKEVFDSKIDAVRNLTTDEAAAFKNRNASILEAYVIPAYKKLSAALSDNAEKSKNQQGLFWFPEGADYYQYLVRSYTGDDRSIEAIEESVKRQMVSDYTAVKKLISAQANSNQAVSAAGRSQPDYLLKKLKEEIVRDFPSLPAVSCKIKYVHRSLSSYLSPAFYLTPAIDDYENNVIYINPAQKCSNLELFTTLAHEGYPGHLFQSVYFSSCEPDLLRTILDTAGYTEGWATYVEMYAYSLWNTGDPQTVLAQHNRSFMLGLASLLDIGIHYHGYSKEEVRTFLEKMGFGRESADDLYQGILEAPANYLKYYVGYLNFLDMRNEMADRMGNRFSLKEFHQRVLELGPAPFSILRAQLGLSERSFQ